MQYLRIKNWERFQHYKDRLPPWIKLHRELLTDYEFCHLPDETKGHLVMVWLLGSQMDGRIPDDAKWVAARIGANRPVNMQALVASGWLIPCEQSASTAPAPRQQLGIVETETYKATETEAEKLRERERAEWVPKAAWEGFVAFRRQQKGWTVRGACLLLGELEKLRAAGHDPTLVIEQSIANGWKGLFPLRNERGIASPRTSMREREIANMDKITGVKNGHAAATAANARGAIDGTAQRVDPAPLPSLPTDLREQRGTDVDRDGRG